VAAHQPTLAAFKNQEGTPESNECPPKFLDLQCPKLSINSAPSEFLIDNPTTTLKQTGLEISAKGNRNDQEAVKR